MKDTITTEELISLITEEMQNAHGWRLEEIANQVLTEKVNYIGNNVFEIIN